MDERHLVAIDIGTSKIALTVAKVEGDNVQIIYYRETPSAGIKYSRVINPSKASGAIRQAVGTAEKELGIRITDMVAGLPKYEVRQNLATLSVDRDADTCVSQEEINDIKGEAIKTYPLENKDSEMLFGAVAQSFGDDENIQIAENDVIGMAPERLESHFKVFVGQKKYVKDLNLAFHNAGDLHVVREYFTPDAIAKAVLYDFEMDNGVALVDLGAGVTSVSIYYGNIMRYYSAIPFGGSAITSDIKTECYITERLAENIKIAYGACLPEKLMSLSDKTLLINSNDAVPAKQVTVKYLSEIITARATEITEAILYEIQKSGFADRLRSGIVITGGGANLLNINNLIKDISGYNVRTGYPKHSFSTSEEAVNDTSAAACIGMILMAKSEKIDCSAQEQEMAEEQVPAANDSLQDSVKVNSIGDKNIDEPVLDDQGKGDLFPDDPADIPPKPQGGGRKTRKKEEGNEEETKKKTYTWKIGNLFNKVKEVVNEINDESI